jgi:hypothetical protein
MRSPLPKSCPTRLACRLIDGRCEINTAQGQHYATSASSESGRAPAVVRITMRRKNRAGSGGGEPGTEERSRGQLSDRPNSTCSPVPCVPHEYAHVQVAG